MKMLLISITAVLISASCGETEARSATSGGGISTSSIHDSRTTSSAVVPATTTLPTTTTMPTPRCGPTQTMAPDVPRVGVLFADAISEMDRQQVINGVRFSQAFIGAHLGGR